MLIRTNVENIGDPFVLCDGKSYYMYATTFDVAGFRVRTSNDLKNWEDGGVCLDLSNSWATKDFWAPEVVYHGGKYVMHYTARRKTDGSLRIGVAISDSPLGPFKDLGVMFDFGYAAIDGHVFMDDDKTPYFYYSKDCSENNVNGIFTSQIWVVKLDESLTKVISQPILVSTPTELYEYDERVSPKRWNEGPFMLKEGGVYYLTYSTNHYASKEYCICLSTSTSPISGFKKSEHNPILSYRNLKSDFSGPGHNAFFKDLKGNLKMTFHIHTDENAPSPNRKAVICDAKIENKTIVFSL